MTAMTLLHSNQAAFERVDQQEASPLFVIPAEIRNTIFELAMAEYDIGRRHEDFSDAELKDDGPAPEVDGQQPTTAESPPTTTTTTTTTTSDEPPPPWLRPGSCLRKTVAVALLQTCKRAYLETYLLPAQTKSHAVYLKSGPGDTPEAYFAGMAPEQLARVRRLRAYCQQYTMEDMPFERHFAPVAAGLEALHVTLRKSDWWGNEYGERMVITPFHADGGRPRQQHMERHMAARPGDLQVHGWGKAFATMPMLRRLTMEFEFHEGRAEELGRIVEWAVRAWKFPMADEGRVLVANGEAERTTWMGFGRQRNHAPRMRRGLPRLGVNMRPSFPVISTRQRMVVYTAVWEPMNVAEVEEPSQGDE